MLVRRTLTALCVVASLGACSLVNSLDGYSGVVTDAGPFADARDANDVSIDAPIDTCGSKLIPSKPVTPDSMPEVAAFTIAMSRLVVSPKDAAGNPQGYNLDGKCTCPDVAPCKPRSAGAEFNCDTPGGVDNAFSAFIKDIQAQIPGSETFLDPNVNIATGDSTLVLRITGWNGKPNDPRVTVGVMSDALSPSSMVRMFGTSTQRLQCIPGAATCRLRLI
jgi:hypothetical protein